MSSVEISALRKRYGAAVALDERQPDGRAGRTREPARSVGLRQRRRRCAASRAFIDPDDGDIRANGVSILTTPSSKRDFGVVFQNYALFPTSSVAENVGYGLLFRKGS